MSENYLVAGNADDINAAVEHLNMFTKNWCMNCKATEYHHEPIFRCSECEFSDKDNRCLLKVFKNHHLKDFEDFGCMCDL